ncbi:MAG: hypothetical protein RMJ98_02885 [Myxococcales bacterium]|nr:hypothetical protein [Polyangiaceae bacterium]MDW8248236.1 hypothetical protein [Myxococcales bacterium]
MTRAMVGILLVMMATACCRKGEKKEQTQPLDTTDTAKNSNARATTTALLPTPQTNAPVLTAAPGAGQASPEVPTGTSPPPTVAEWSAAAEVNTVHVNSKPKDCSMKMVREWLKVNCTGNIREVTNREGFGKYGVDSFEKIVPGTMADLVVRMKKGGAIKARILRNGESGASLFVNWPSQLDKPSIVALQIFNG